MKMFAGLGNPGAEYAATRHNVGFMLADALAARWDATAWRTKQDALVAEARLGAEKILLVKPLTYMNESGRAVGPLLSWYKLDAGDLIVAHDDMDLPVGTIRLRKKGGAGGHNGMKSLLYHVRDENFPRVRIGVGHPVPSAEAYSVAAQAFDVFFACHVKDSFVVDSGVPGSHIVTLFPEKSKPENVQIMIGDSVRFVVYYASCAV